MKGPIHSFQKLWLDENKMDNFGLKAIALDTTSPL